MRRWLTAVCFALGFVPSTALAQWSDQGTQYYDEGAVRTEPNRRRSEVTLGATAGVVTGIASAFPNEIAKIDDPRFESSTGFGAGGYGSAWLGGALSDWLTFGIGGAGGSMNGSRGHASLGAFLFRVETYPMIGLGGALGDVGIFTDLGLGTLTVEEGDKEKGEGGALSFVGVGALFEAVRFGHFALGPNAEYMHLWSVTGTVHAAHIALRIAYYGGPDEPAAAPINRSHARR